MTDQPIPFLDLITPHCELEEELVHVLRKALRSGTFVGGPEVEGFEREFAASSEAGCCVGVASGTDALRFALMATGVQPGDSVVTVPNTFIATTEAITQAGAQPEFVDVDKRTYTMDPVRLREYVERNCTRDGRTGGLVNTRTGSRVRAVVPVHLYGQMADMDAITEVAADYGLVVVEDACQAQGARYFSRKEQRWQAAGSIGHAAAFSFYPGKNLGACGEAGAITTNDEHVAAACRMLRDHGQSKKYFHDIEGYNGRLDAIQAGFLRVKLRHLVEWNDHRRARARVYDELFVDHSGVVTTGLSLVRCSGRSSGGPPTPPRQDGRGNGHSLPDTVAPSEGVRALRIRGRQLSRRRRSRVSDPLAPDVPQFDRGGSASGRL
jgi:dTDP-4-amino-4,6-dideoxygalactose transaminase